MFSGLLAGEPKLGDHTPSHQHETLRLLTPRFGGPFRLLAAEMFGLYLAWLHTVTGGFRRLHKSRRTAGTGPKALGEKCEKPNEKGVFEKS